MATQCAARGETRNTKSACISKEATICQCDQEPGLRADERASPSFPRARTHALWLGACGCGSFFFAIGTHLYGKRKAFSRPEPRDLCQIAISSTKPLVTVLFTTPPENRTHLKQDTATVLLPNSLRGLFRYLAAPCSLVTPESKPVSNKQTDVFASRRQAVAGRREKLKNRRAKIHKTHMLHAETLRPSPATDRPVDEPTIMAALHTS